MRLIEYMQLIERIHNLIDRRSTGSPEAFASKINCSRATLYRYLQDLKDLGAAISYDRSRESFFYEKKFDLKFQEKSTSLSR